MSAPETEELEFGVGAAWKTSATAMALLSMEWKPLSVKGVGL
jgi:hypothetical protein